MMKPATSFSIHDPNIYLIKVLTSPAVDVEFEKNLPSQELIVAKERGLVEREGIISLFLKKLYESQLKKK